MHIVDRSDLTGPVVKGDKRKGAPSLIVVHRNTVAPDVAATAAWYASPPPGNEQYWFRLFPYHFFVDDDGSVHQVHSLDTISPHAGPQGFNGPGVGIALNHDGRKSRPPEVMLDAAIVLMTYIMATCRIRSVVGHSFPKGCPGKFVPVEDMSRAARHAAETTPLVADGLRLTRDW